MVSAAVVARAESLLPPQAVSFESLAAFRPTGANWHLAGGLGGDPRHDKQLTPLAGTGLLVSNPQPGGHNGDLVTTWEHGDIDVDLDYLIPPGSNSGLYLQGRYEVQIFDSWGVKQPKYSDNGGLYQRWDDARGKGNEGYDGHAPLANASRAPGLWQHLHVEFRAPRFDAAGKKIAKARFVKVVLNGYVVHENVELDGPTRGAAFPDETKPGPLLVQGDHGAVALRHLVFKRYADVRPELKQAHVKYYNPPNAHLDDYVRPTPAREADLQHLSDAVVKSDDRGVALVSGTFVAPTAGDYEFRPDINGPVRMYLDGRLAVQPTISSEPAGVVTLTAGEHALKLEYMHLGSWALNGGGLKLWVEGPGIPRHSLLPAAPKPAAAERTVSIPVDPTDRVILQRTFVMLPKSRRMYACFVGSPAGVHYAYDFEQAAVIGVWRGGFFEGKDLWHERAEDQQAHPTGPGFPIEGRPLLFQFGDHDAFWPTQPPQPSESRGYRLEADGQPVFRYFFAGITAEDRIAARADGTGLERTLKFGGKSYGRETWALLAESSSITPQPDGGGYIIGDREYYLDLPKDSPAKPLYRHEGDRVQLLVRVPESGVREFTYNLIW